MKRILIIALGLTLFSSSISMAGNEQFPPPELVGTWTGTVEIFGSFKVEPYPSKAPEDHQQVVITIHADGTVIGKIGNAEFKNSSVSKNRGWIGRKLKVKTDYIVSGGTIQGKVTPNDNGTNSKFTIPFNIKDGTFKGTIMLLPKFPLTRPLQLTKQKENSEQRK